MASANQEESRSNCARANVVTRCARVRYELILLTFLRNVSIFDFKIVLNGAQFDNANATLHYYRFINKLFH
jgi:hypothetical protein